jgi:uncharacterized alkaline shock family protein YloU
LSNFFFSLLGLATAGVVFATAVGCYFPIMFLTEQFETRDARLAIALVSLLVAIWAIYSFYSLQFSGSKKAEAKYVQIDTTNQGQIHITMEALESYIVRAVNTVKGVREVKPKIKVLPEGMKLLLRITIAPDTNVPDVTKDIQQKVSQYLKEYGGIEVSDVEVVVDKIAQPTKSRVD